MDHYIAEFMIAWNQVPDLSETTVKTMLAMCMFSTFLARVILQTTVNGLPFLFCGMLLGSYASIHLMQHWDMLSFGHTELQDASLASMIGIGLSIVPTAYLMKLLAGEA